MRILTRRWGITKAVGLVWAPRQPNNTPWATAQPSAVTPVLPQRTRFGILSESEHCTLLPGGAPQTLTWKQSPTRNRKTIFRMPKWEGDTPLRLKAPFVSLAFPPRPTQTPTPTWWWETVPPSGRQHPHTHPGEVCSDPTRSHLGGSLRCPNSSHCCPALRGNPPTWVGRGAPSPQLAARLSTNSCCSRESSVPWMAANACIRPAVRWGRGGR